jgi:hypothetical protein
MDYLSSEIFATNHFGGNTSQVTEMEYFFNSLDKVTSLGNLGQSIRQAWIIFG